jgi:ribosomal protein L19
MIINEKLNYKYNSIFFFKKQSLQIGSIINVTTLGTNFRSNFFGILIKKKHKNFNGCYITLRNVMKKSGLEKSFNLNSPFIKKIYLLKNKSLNINNRFNLYFLRNISKIYSTFL